MHVCLLYTHIDDIFHIIDNETIKKFPRRFFVPPTRARALCMPYEFTASALFAGKESRVVVEYAQKIRCARSFNLSGRYIYCIIAFRHSNPIKSGLLAGLIRT